MLSETLQTWGNMGGLGGVEAHYYFVLLCRMFTFTQILPVSVFAFDWSSQNVSPPPLSRPPPPPPKSSSTLCVIYAPSGKGVCPHCIPCCVTDQSIEMLPLFPLSALPFFFFPSIPSSPTSARQPIHLMQFPRSLSLGPCRLPLSLPAPLSLPLSFAQVMSYFFSWILLPPSLALQGFPLAGGFPQRSILSAEGREWEDVLRRDV